MTTLTFDNGKYTIDTDAVPAASVSVMLQQAFNHRLGNQVASAVVARAKNETGNPDLDREGMKAFREANAALIAEWEHELRSAVVADIMAGTLGVSKERGPRKDPVEKEFDSLVLAFVKASLKQSGRKLPKDDETVLNFGNGITRTRSQMLANAATSQGERLRKEAEKIVAERARLEARMSRDAAKSEDQTPDALGI